MKISSRSLWYRLAYGNEKPSQVTVCDLAGSLCFRSFMYLILGIILACAASVVLCISAVAIPVALLLGQRPCFITFWKNECRGPLSKEYPMLALGEGTQVWPIIPCLSIATGYLTLRYADHNLSNTISAWMFVDLGMLLLILTILRQFKIWDAFAKMADAVRTKTCIPIEVTE